MCGIVGIVSPGAPRHGDALHRMVDSLQHRGPDGRGAQVFPGCALGHTRLSVIDVAGGAQPMLTLDGRTAVVFNGEIYGYKALRQHELHEYPFRTSSDTEVLLALYERDGASMLDRLPGMFAFAIWDDRRQRLLCARDRFGEKPFFYATADDGTFVFASEIKAILASGFIEPVVDCDSVEHYLRYLYVHPHRTIYRNVHVLPPAHRLIHEDGRVQVAPYWRLPEPGAAIGLPEAADRFRTLLARAVERQLVADVPVGAFLSGGLDSSTIVALASRAQGRCRTFSFGFAPVIDERPFARGIAERYGTEHREITDARTNLADMAVRMAAVYDEPFGDSSNVPTYLLCQEARRHVTVVLTGEGADELLGGYSFWYRALFEMEQAAGLDAAATLVARVAGAVCRRTGVVPPDWIGRANRGAVLSHRYPSIGAVHADQTATFSAAESRALVPAARTDWLATRPPSRSVDDALRSDLVTYLPGDILVKTDRASMAHGLELRAPFLDWELASFCASLPVSLKISNDRDKLVLRQAFEDAWTPAVRARGKQGFGAPVVEWLQRPALRALVRDVLRGRNSKLYDFVSASAVQSVIDTDDTRTWPLLMLALWAESTRASNRAAQPLAGSALAMRL
jgi:asparagine synthase (glutamine-hydrolysing)